MLGNGKAHDLPRAIVVPAHQAADALQQGSSADLKLIGRKLWNDHSLPILYRACLEKQHALFLVDQNLDLSRLLQMIQYVLVQQDALLLRAERHNQRFVSHERNDLIDYYTNYIKSRPDWEFVSVYSDEGKTGCNTRKREGFKNMVDDALDGKIEIKTAKLIQFDFSCAATF